MDAKPRKCPRCAADLKAAPLTFTLAYACNGCGLILTRAQDAERVAEELSALRSGGLTPITVLERAPVMAFKKAA